MGRIMQRGGGRKPRDRRRPTVPFAVGGMIACLGSAALAQPIDLDLDTAVETEVQATETEPVVPAAELVDEIQSTPQADPVVLNGQTPAAETATAQSAPPSQTQRRRRVVVGPPPPFIVREVRVSPSAYLDEAAIDAVAAGIVGSRIAISALGDVAAQFDALYDAENIALAQALIEHVDPRAGVIEIELLEARIGAVQPNGRLATEAYYRKRIGVAPGDLADNRIIQANLQRFSVTDGIVADARFVPGAERGQTDLVIDFAEPQKYTFTMSVDTFGTRSTGEYRARFGFTDASLTGVLDPLNLSVTITEGSQAGSVSYARPVNALGTRIFGSVDLERSQTLNALKVRAHSFNGEVGVTHAVKTEPQFRILARGSVIGFFDESILAGIRINDQIGGGVQAGATFVYEQPGLLASYDQLIRHVIWDDRVFAQTGLGTTYLAGNATLIRRLVDGVGLSMRGGWQLAVGDRAPTAYRTTIASPEIVRGYPTGQAAGDSFYWLRTQVELDTPVGEDAGWALRPFAFFDFGQGFDLIAGTNFAQDDLASIGAGVAVQIGDWGTGEVFVSKPLVNANGFNASQSARIDGRVALRF